MPLAWPRRARPVYVRPAFEQAKPARAGSPPTRITRLVQTPPREYSFGPWRVDVSGRRLLQADRPAKLGARAFDLLLALLQRRDRAVSKNELLALVWPGLVVEENNLQVHISALRKLLGPQAIATIPGRGYRFTLPVDDSGAAPAAAAAADAQAPAHAALGSVPLRTDTLIGRDVELRELTEWVTARRVVSVVGAGGIGKSRLALAAAQAMRAGFADGAWWIELAPLTDPSRLPETVAGALGMQLGSGRPPNAGLAAALAGQQALIVLDNCEHLLEPVASLIDEVVQRADTVRFLVTTQEPLKIAPEHVFRLGPLRVPERDAPAASTALDRYGAVALFVERARAVDPGFALSPENAEAVAQICRRLDGIALAIELAAARLPLLGIEGLRARLGERFRLLTAGSRTVLRRHQTLRAALEWSHGLLTSAEQTVFRRLGVFVGSFALESAQHVASDAALDGWAVLDALGQLVDKSLVVADAGAEPRYRLLETTRAFALEQLAAAGETQVVLRRHAAALLLLLQRLGAGHLRIDRVHVQAFDAEIDNLRAALDWAIGPDGDRSLALGLAAESDHVWFTRAAQAEGLERLGQVMTSFGDDTSPTVAARFWLTYANLGVFSTRLDCFEAAGRAAELYHGLRQRERTFEALVVRAAIAGRRGDAGAALPALQEAQRLEDARWPAQRRAALAFAQWIVALNLGRYEEARSHALRQADLNREATNPLGEQLALGNAATCDVWGGHPARSIEPLRAVIARLEAIGHGYAAGHMLYNLAVALVLVGALDEALQQARRAYPLLRREGDQAIMLSLLVRLAAARADPVGALRLSGYARRVRAELGLDAAQFAAWAEQPIPPTVPASERERLFAEGAALTEEQAFALVLS